MNIERFLTPPTLYPTLTEEQETSFLTSGIAPSSGGLTLTWRNLSVWATKSESILPWKAKPEPTQILKNVSGIARAGRLVAIMGASGAGKTTLLATISQRIKGESEGKICVNGQPMSRDLLRRLSGFVPQQDLAVESLTVLEHMEFMGRLKVSQHMSTFDRQLWVRSLLSELGLTKCEHTRLSSLSGGERKRLSLAVQLLTDPPILFCDEPTTGLDSYSAGAVVEKLKQLSLKGMAVVCTIHQPASGIFDLFHELILLAGGRVAYQGEVRAANSYFSSKGLTCPATYNAAEFYVSQLAIRPGREEMSAKQVTWLCDQFETSQEGKILLNAVKKAETTTLEHSVNEWGYPVIADYIENKSLGRPTWCSQLYWVMWRSMKDAKRNKANSVLRLIFFMFVGMVISVPFIGILDAQRGVQNMQGLLYLIVVETIFTFAYSVFDTFPHEMPVLLREISDALYLPGPYYVSKMLMMVPRCVIGTFLYTLLIFCVVGLQGGVIGFLALCVPVMLCAASATAYGCMMSSLFESISTASLLSVPVELVTIAFSGVFLKISSLPDHISWLRYISQFYYANEAASIIHWQKIDDIECSDIPGAPCLRNGEEVLEQYGFRADNLTVDLLGLCSIYCFAHVIGFLSLLRRSRKQAIY